MFPLKSRIAARIAALPGVGAIAFFGCTLPVTLAISLAFGPVSWMGYLPSALFGAFFGVSAALTILGATGRAIAKVNGAPFQKGDMVQVLRGKHKGVKGKVEEPRVAHHGAHGSIIVDVDGESTAYHELDIFLIERVNGEAS